MKVYTEVIQKNDFAFWAGAAHTVYNLTEAQFETVLYTLEESHKDGISDVELNDFFWFDTDIIAEWLGFDSWEDLEKANWG